MMNQWQSPLVRQITLIGYSAKRVSAQEEKRKRKEKPRWACLCSDHNFTNLVQFLPIFAFPSLPLPFATFFRYIIRRYISKSSVKMLSKVHSPKFSGFPFWATNTDHCHHLLVTRDISSHAGVECTNEFATGYRLCSLLKCSFLAKIPPTWGVTTARFSSQLVLC